MADAVTSNVLVNNKSHYVVHCTNVSDGTGESAVVKADISTLTMAHAQSGQADITPTHFAVERVFGTVFGQDATTAENISLLLAFDATTDDTFLYVANGAFDFDWTPFGGLIDPQSTGTTGDIVATFDSTAVAGDGYSFTMVLRKKA